MSYPLLKTPIDLTSTVYEPWTVVNSMSVEPMNLTYKNEIHYLFNLGVIVFVEPSQLKTRISTRLIDKVTEVTNMMASRASLWTLMSAPMEWTDLEACERLKAKPSNDVDRELMNLNTCMGVVTWYVRVNEVYDCAVTMVRLTDGGVHG